MCCNPRANHNLTRVRKLARPQDTIRQRHVHCQTTCHLKIPLKRWSAFVGCRITAGYKVLIHSLIHQSYNTPVDQNVHEAWLQNMRVSSILLLATNIVLLSPGNYQLKLKMQSGVTLGLQQTFKFPTVQCVVFLLHRSMRH